MRKTQEKEPQHKHIDVNEGVVPSLGVLEGDILRLMWDAGEALSSVQVYEAMYMARKRDGEEMQSPSTIAVTLSRMSEKGLLTVERRPRGGKGYYAPTRTRAQVVAHVMEEVCLRLTGRPLGYFLQRLGQEGSNMNSEPTTEDANPDAGLEELIRALRRRQQEDNQFVPVAAEL